LRIKDLRQIIRAKEGINPSNLTAGLPMSSQAVQAVLYQEGWNFFLKLRMFIDVAQKCP